jgi:DNA mismatch repair protein MutL
LNPERSATIHVLDPATVNQIAAGEVVERPASVVKELVENSIDAGATRVIIEVQSDRGGIGVIRVVDNGSGMTWDDAGLAFVPHATSKIRTIDDLRKSRTMGFRGEALASIASVAEVALATAGHGPGSTGTEIIVRAGTIVRSGEKGTPPGTTITVRDLFFNTPARKKFQKPVSSEIAFLTRQIETFAIAHPGIAFRFIHNGVDRIVTEGNGDLFELLVSLYGTTLTNELIPVESAEGPVKISGYITKPSHSRQNPYGILISINRRQVLARTVSDAIREGYGTLLPDNRYPLAFIGLTIDPAYIDVNVHPAKRLVRLSRERDICSLVTKTVVQVLRGADLVPKAPKNLSVADSKTAGSTPYDTKGMPDGIVREPVLAEYLLTDRRLRQTELFPGTSERDENLLDIEFLGQYDGIYLIGRGAGGDLLLIDQHAAHERVLYDRLSMARELPDASQELIVPVILTVTPAEFQFIGAAIPQLTGKGFEIEEFGRDSYAVRAIPAALGTVTGHEIIKEIILEFSGSRRSAGPDAAEALTRSIACHGAVKAGTVMTPEQCRRLIHQLSRTTSPWTCPHGRPVMISLTRDRLDQMFYRK